MDILRSTALTILIIGGLNWGSIGLFNMDLVQLIFGGDTVYRASMLSRIIYTLVGASAIYALTFYRMSETRRQTADNRS